MKIRHALNLSTVAVVLAGGTSLMAQVTTGALNGHVTDNTGKPIVGARVSLESSALFQARVLTTDAKGEFRALLLPVGNYTVKVSARDFVGKTNTEVRIGVGANLTLDFSLKAAKEATATIEVVANIAQEAKTDDKVSSNYSAEQLLQLPTDRSFNGALILAPGITGSGVSAQVRGSGANQINYRIDGIDVKDDSGNSQALYQPLQDSIEDVQVVLSALNARNGRSQGGQVNVATKSGSNTFEGTIRSYQSRLSWTVDKPYADNSTKNSNATQSLSHYTDITFSGPIWKDRIWFYVGTRLQPSVTANTHFVGYEGTRTVNGKQLSIEDIIVSPMNTYGKYPAVDAELLNPTAGTTPGGLPSGYSLKNSFQDLHSPVVADTKFKKLEGKLTGMITESNILTFTYLSQKQDSGGQSSEGLPPWITLEKSMIGAATDKVTAYTVGLNSNLATNWTLETRYFKATHDKSQFFHQDAGYNSGSVYGFFSTGTRGTMYAPTDRLSFLGGISFWGPFANAVNASAPDPSREGNQGLTFNLKTFQDLAGQHEIDLGGERFETINNLGRARNGNLGVWTGGWYTNPSAGAGKEYLYPVFYANNGLLFPDDVTDKEINWLDKQLRGPSATVEKFWVRSTNTKNKANAFWINDIYTINPQWNVLVGLRYNQFSIDDTTGAKLSSLSLVEPRFQVKWNPDSRGANVFSLSWAKLASQYSDALAGSFRASEWEVRTVHHWKGLAGQPAVDSAAAASDPTHGVRYVTYAQLTDTEHNYGPAVEYVDARQFYKAGDLKVPFAYEINFGYDHNYDTGNVRLDLVQRTYKNNWLSRIRGYGAQYDTLMTDPCNTGGAPIWQQNEYWMNSGLDQVFRSVEISWQKKTSENLTFGGSCSYSQKTGYNEVDYYNYQQLRESLPSDVQNSSVGKGVLSRDLVLRAHLTYVLPVGKGNVSASIMGAYYTPGVANMYGLNAYSTTPYWDTDANGNTTYQGHTIIPINPRGDAGGDGLNGTADSALRYKTYYGALGSWKSGYDITEFNVKLQAQVPLGLGKTVLLATLQVNDIFNHVHPLSNGAFYDWAGDNNNTALVGNGIVQGRPLANFNNPWGKTANQTAYSQGRNITDFSIGLKF